jgi:hypothetical protein
VTAPTPTPTPTFTQQILGATAPNTAMGQSTARPSADGWQGLVAIAAGILAALFMLTPRRKRRLE